MSDQVAVIGLGATGAFAARAAFDLGYKVDIYNMVDTPNLTPPGAFWLHWLPEDMTGEFEATPIYIMGKGTEKGYLNRQWGRTIAKGLSSSFPSKAVWEQGYHPAKILPKIVPDECEIMMIPYPLSDVDVRDLAIKYAAVFQTFPSKDSKAFQPPLLPYIAGAKFATDDPTSNWVIYNGTDKGLVVREASLWGNHFVEFPKNVSLSEVQLDFDLSGFQHVVLRDIDPRTQPWEGKIDPKVHYVGRWATWDRKYLSHDAYKHTQKILKKVQNG